MLIFKKKNCKGEFLITVYCIFSFRSDLWAETAPYLFKLPRQYYCTATSLWELTPTRMPTTTHCRNESPSLSLWAESAPTPTPTSPHCHDDTPTSSLWVELAPDPTPTSPHLGNTSYTRPSQPRHQRSYHNQTPKPYPYSL